MWLFGFRILKGVDILIIIAVVDDDYGLMFNHRRQSQDRCLREYILNMTKNSKLFMNAYSFEQFSESIENNISVDDEFMNHAKERDYCFIENTDIRPYLNKVSQVILFRWNRRYPSDQKFPKDLLELFNKNTEKDLKGNSHPKITEEIYLRR